MLGLMAATAFGAHGFAKYQAEGREMRMRDYSSPEKWLEPKYANRKDMEDVSLPKS
jgi:D-lactate dehydrogenase (cytochrome)